MTSAPTPVRLESLVSACSAITEHRAATKARWRRSDDDRLTARTRSSTASSASGGTSVTARAKRTICVLVERRTEKNSGFLPRMSRSGSARAKPESTASWAPRTSAVRVRLGSVLRARKVKGPGTACELFRAHDVEALVEALLEPVGPVVGVVYGPLPRQQSAGHRVLG